MEKQTLDQLAERVIGLAITVHRTLGPGLLESVYEAALAIELGEAALRFERQKALPVTYREQAIGEFRTDFVVEQALILEIKSVERHDPVLRSASPHLPKALGHSPRTPHQLQLPPAQGRDQTAHSLNIIGHGDTELKPGSKTPIRCRQRSGPYPSTTAFSASPCLRASVANT